MFVLKNSLGLTCGILHDAFLSAQICYRNKVVHFRTSLRSVDYETENIVDDKLAHFLPVFPNTTKFYVKHLVPP